MTHMTPTTRDPKGTPPAAADAVLSDEGSFCPTCGQSLARTRLHQVRIQRRLSLRDIAPKVGLSISQLSRLERQESEPGLATARRLARYYEVDLDWLFPSEEEAQS